MTECKVGDIVSIEFPFSDLQGQNGDRDWSWPLMKTTFYSPA